MSEDGKSGLDARRAAVGLLGAVLAEARMLSDAVGGLHRLAPADRARAQTLATTVLRRLSQIDSVLDARLDRRPPIRAMNALRVCAAEILIDGIAPHGAVNAAVAAVKASPKTARLAGLVNAVGRQLEGATLDGLPPPQLPKAIRGALVKAWGEEAVQAMEAVHAQRPPIDLSVKADAPGWADRLGARLLPNGSLRLDPGVQLSALPGYDTGDWWVQDAAATMPARLLGDARGKRVLDLCAAPGGKTLQLAAGGAQVTALDISEQRMERVRENLGRTGLSATCVVADALDWTPDAPFDAILLDAPCSATGTIRRHPDLPHVRPSLDLKPVLDLQARLLDRAAEWLVPGGQLVYAVCSLIPAEGERQVARALAAGPLEAGPLPPGMDPDWRTAECGVRLRPDFWPELGGMDGFFAALLQRPA